MHTTWLTAEEMGRACKRTHIPHLPQGVKDARENTGPTPTTVRQNNNRPPKKPCSN
ncbi:hypothetical protein J4Q44_G00076520 [Coregonus suidteri]|uniref:Uncharacterized protein n=1 Tax=Coregonus suidteri TaxID=861788 RepID=A0AAN8M1D3_9TELE